MRTKQQNGRYVIYETDNKKVAWLKNFMNEEGLSVNDISEAIGRSHAYIYDRLNSKRRLRKAFFIAICYVYGIDNVEQIWEEINDDYG